MNDPQIRVKRDEEYSSRGNVKYVCEVWHKGLNDYRCLTSSDEDVLENKVEAHIIKLQTKWSAYQEKRNVSNSKEANIREAEQRSKSAKDDLLSIEDLLLFTLEIDDAINWNSLFDRTPYEDQDPLNYLGNRTKKIPKPVREPYQVLAAIPDRLHEKYNPKLDWVEKLIPYFAKDKVTKAETSYTRDITSWQEITENAKRTNERIDQEYTQKTSDYNVQVEELRNKVREESKQWVIDKAKFEEKRKKINDKVELLRIDYMAGKPDAIVEACEIVLNNSLYPDFISKNFEIEYNPDSKILIVEFSLPAPDQLPTLSEVKFIKNELKEYHISDTQSAKNFDSVVYKITLRTLHELFEADQINAIDAISFNGWVNSIDKSTGQRVNSCIVSIQAKKGEFMQVDLQHVDPKSCFKSLKGIGSSKLTGLTAVQPILRIDKSDKRFVEHYDVADSMDDSTNIASMGWEDFEHLIREVFAKEFNQSGGEVKVTQASKDGGVDAIAFDPDPIRGGKIVIQAKRYTNTVGVSAVRDLYGTVMNEGATKGILVTTADYGPDAYEFSKGKPITLMNGANLLYLLEKHGHKARIDIKEAKLLSKNR